MLQDAFSSPPAPETAPSQAARDAPSCMLSADVRNKIHQAFPKFTIMSGGYVPMCARVSAASTEDSSSVTDAEHDVICGSGGLLHLHCPIWYKRSTPPPKKQNSSNFARLATFVCKCNSCPYEMSIARVNSGFVAMENSECDKFGRKWQCITIRRHMEIL